MPTKTKALAIRIVAAASTSSTVALIGAIIREGHWGHYVAAGITGCTAILGWLQHVEAASGGTETPTS